MLKINSPLSCKRNWNILFFNRYNYEFIQTTQNSTFEEKEILYIFAPDGLVAINETKNGLNKMFYISSDHLGSNCNTLATF
ncbi:MAG: hypothetical protein PHR79_05610 [Bacteroidales bacterium]|nr:hypothetical protein [Bacteroidales bacterium]